MTLRTLSLGGIAWNTMIYVDTFPEPRPQTVFARGSHTTVGSSGAGKALNFASLGADAALWGLLGDDDSGEKVRSYLTAAGVELVAPEDPAGTMHHVNLMNAAGDRISIFANAGSSEFNVDLAQVRPLVAAADVISVSIMNYCRQFLPMLRGMGKPVWVLLKTDADWRWLLDRTDNPWYPTMRLFRQKQAGDWAVVLNQVADELARLVTARGSKEDA